MEVDNKIKTWVEDAINKDYTRLQIRKKLKEIEYPEEFSNMVLDYYDFRTDQIYKQTKEKNVEEEEIFEKKVDTYFEDKTKLTWSDRRDVKKFLKKAKQYSDILNKTIISFKNEIESFSERGLDETSVSKEMEALKIEIIESLLESRGLLDIEHPITKEEITKDNLMELDINQLIELMEENVIALDLVVNGKTTN